MIKNVFFDVMGVIFVVGDDTNDLLVPFVQKLKTNVARDRIIELYTDASLGKLTSREFWLSIGVDERDKEYVEKKYLDENLVLDPDIIEVIKALKDQGYKIGFLSNDISEWGQYLRKKFDLNSLLDYCVISGDIGLRKPDKGIYEYVVKEFKVSPQESIFIDDRIKNLIEAKKYGFKTILFDRENVCENHSFNKVNSSIELLKTVDGLN